MGTTREMIEEWFDEGVSSKATHLVVVCDTFDWEDYPVYVTEKQDVKEIVAKYDGPNMQKVMEVYNLRQPKAAQLKAVRSFNY